MKFFDAPVPSSFNIRCSLFIIQIIKINLSVYIFTLIFAILLYSKQGRLCWNF
jgi:hypothetical protein